ncbi:hypothetical protein GCM10010191_59590 [Actinomadura vinacea]|uniref:Uncharacterized protein n=1 Tax=Actinomadura vinacea TaxID=115336 RepID=A0ABN3JTL7_9ACTN
MIGRKMPVAVRAAYTRKMNAARAVAAARMRGRRNALHGFAPRSAPTGCAPWPRTTTTSAASP